MLFTKAVKYFYQSLLNGILNILERILLHYLTKELNQKCLQKEAVIIRPVYDLINCGDRHRFMINNDMISHNCQRSSHGLLTMITTKINELRLEREIPMYPWLADYHDETDWEVLAGYEMQARQVIEEAYSWINSHRLIDIPIKGDIIIADNFAEIKCKE